MYRTGGALVAAALVLGIVVGTPASSVQPRSTSRLAPWHRRERQAGGESLPELRMRGAGDRHAHSDAFAGLEESPEAVR